MPNLLIPPRFVHKNATIYDFSICKACGSAGAADSPACRTTACMACGSTVCRSHGLRDGTCPICFRGILPGWSGADQNCSYKNCPNKAVFRNGAKACCSEHAQTAKKRGINKKQTVVEYIKDCLESRKHNWVLVSEVTVR